MKINIPDQLRQWLRWPQLLQHPRLPDLGAVVLGLASLYGAAALTWQLLGLALPGEESGTMLAMAYQGDEAASRPLSNLSLFGGQKSATAAYGSTSMMDAPDTQLNLRLVGIIASSNPNIARAIIIPGGGREAYYAIGASLPGGAIIRAIYDDRVIIEYNGRYEALRLPKTILTTITPSRPKSPVQPSTDTGSDEVKVSLNSEEISQYRQQLLNDPMSLNGKLRLRSVTENGQISGYRVYPGNDVPLFNKLGLQGGDMITSINGISVADTVGITNLYSQVGSMSEIKVEFERNGQKKFIKVPLNR